MEEFCWEMVCRFHCLFFAFVLFSRAVRADILGIVENLPGDGMILLHLERPVQRMRGSPPLKMGDYNNNTVPPLQTQTNQKTPMRKAKKKNTVQTSPNQDQNPAVPHQDQRYQQYKTSNYARVRSRSRLSQHPFQAYVC